MSLNKQTVIIGIIGGFSLMVFAGYLFRTGSISNYETKRDYLEVMVNVQEGLLARGYKIEKIQPIDRGLKKEGLNVAPYRVIFYYPTTEFSSIQTRYPKFSALLPLSIIIAQQDNKLKITGPPYGFILKHANDRQLYSLVKKWQKDSEQIIKNAL